MSKEISVTETEASGTSEVPATEESVITSQVTETAPVTTPAETSEETTETSEVTEETTATEETEETSPVSTEPEPVIPEELEYDWSSPVPESWVAKDSSYYDTCAFVGDSHTNGLGGYGFVNTSRVFARDGLSISNIRESISVSAIAAVNPENVYIMMGTNGVAWLKPEDMVESYESFVNEIEASLPYANIYILSIPPVSYERSSTTDAKKNISIDRINTYNEQLLEMAESNHWYYVDTFSAVCNDYGYLDSTMTTDGVHMKKELYNSFLDYILNHTVD